MPKYSVTINGKDFDVTADNPQDAAFAAHQVAGGAQSATPAAPAPAKARPGIVQNITGAMANFNRGLGIGDELAAGADTVGKLVTGAAPLGDIGGAYKASLAKQRSIEDGYTAQHPHAAALARGTGMAATAAAPTAPALQGGRVLNMVRGATGAAVTGAAYGLADRGTALERAKAANLNAFNPLTLALGAGAGALAPAIRAPVQRNTPAQVLRAEGVPLTPGQRMGGMAKNAEDLAQRAPILGPTIRGARQRGVEGLNVAFANRALEPLGETLPAGIRPGHEATTYVADRLGQAYDDAAALVPQVAPDQAFGQALGQISQRVNELPTDVGAQFTNILANRLESRLTNGPVTGTQLRMIQSEIGNIAAQRGASNDVAQQALGDMLDDVSTELGSLLGRTNPEAGDIVQRANAGWANYVRLRNAASRAKGGVASPAQLTQAVRMQDRSVGKGNVARGRALGQDLTDAASQVMPDAFGSPGTADAASLMALGGLTLANPPKGLAVGAGLGAASIPYALMGRGPIRPQGLAQPLSPAEEAARRLVAARLARSGGLVGGTAAQGVSTR